MKLTKETLGSTYTNKVNAYSRSKVQINELKQDLHSDRDSPHTAKRQQKQAEIVDDLPIKPSSHLRVL
jgi:hypothetical protein